MSKAPRQVQWMPRSGDKWIGINDPELIRSLNPSEPEFSDDWQNAMEEMRRDIEDLKREVRPR